MIRALSVALLVFTLGAGVVGYVLGKADGAPVSAPGRWVSCFGVADGAPYFGLCYRLTGGEFLIGSAVRWAR